MFFYSGHSRQHLVTWYKNNIVEITQGQHKPCTLLLGGALFISRERRCHFQEMPCSFLGDALFPSTARVNVKPHATGRIWSLTQHMSRHVNHLQLYINVRSNFFYQYQQLKKKENILNNTKNNVTLEYLSFN